MDNDKATIVFQMIRRNISVDLEIPLDITAMELVIGLDNTYELGVDVSNIKNCYLKAENPIALLRGSKTLKQYGIRTGSVIYFTE